MYEFLERNTDLKVEIDQMRHRFLIPESFNVCRSESFQTLRLSAERLDENGAGE